jgi:branched-chain amino acid transport system ATP-binding protein
MLKLDGVQAHYGAVQVLRDFSLELLSGEVLCLMGRNGAGKTTCLKTIMGLVQANGGEIVFDGQVITKLAAHQVPKLGIGYVPQGRRLFAELTVKENLDVGLMTRGSAESVRERVLSLFPLLKERLKQRSGTMSGGEQQMLAIARALCIDPKVLLLDEPTEGLMPQMIERIQDVVKSLKEQGVSVLLVEQRAAAALAVADRVAFVEGGHVRAVVSGAEVKRDPGLIAKYAGVSVGAG